MPAALTDNLEKSPARPEGPTSAKPLGPTRRSLVERIPIGFVLRRIAVVPLLVLLIASGSFFALRAIPGDPAELIAGAYSTPEQVDEIRHELGIDRPVLEQYVDLMSGLVKGDLGRSYTDGRPVTTHIWERLPVDLVLVAAALGIAVLFGVVAGVVGAYWRRRWPDKFTSVGIGVLQATPDFVMGLVLILVLAFRTGIFPQPTGQLGLGAIPPPDVTGVVVIDALLAREWSTFWDAATRMILPAVSLATVITAVVARVTRAGVVNGLRSTQAEYARALGLRERTVVGSALAMARTSIVTYVAVMFGTMVGGAAIVQRVFNWNGLGMWGLEAIGARDLPSIQGFVIVTGTFTLLVYVVLDVTVALLDPRIRLK